MTQIILIVITNFVTDIGPCLSVLEVKFIELFKQSTPKERYNTEDENSLSGE